MLKENAFEAQGIVQDINDYFHAHYREGEYLNFSRKEL
jgi:two-component system response regulator YesN